MAFLARNFLQHIDEYAPQQYLRAALRELAKEYAREREIRSQSVPVDTILERVTPDGTEVEPPEPVADEAPAYATEYAYVREEKPDGEIFYDWFVGNLSRLELAKLYGFTLDQVNRAILRVAQGVFEQGRLYPLVSSLVHLNEDGDILWLSLKGLTGEQIGQKVSKSHWVVYKRLDSLRKRFGRLRELGDAGRVFGAWLCGRQTGPEQAAAVRRILHEYGAELGLHETEFEDPALSVS